MNLRTILVSCAAVVGSASFGWTASGQAALQGTQPNTPISGIVILEDTQDGLKIDAQISQVSPGEHAFHIHEFGSCQDQGQAAGSHYNPAGHPHGNLIKDGIEHAHAGDFGNITIGPDGKGSLRAVIHGLSLNDGKYNVAGRAFILHAKPDDFSQPTGNAGSRIGCAPILITKS